jgi:hypothetical protein
MFDNLLQQLEAYPRWLVLLGTVGGSVVAVWALAKILKWTFYLLAVALVGGLALFGILWWLG